MWVLRKRRELARRAEQARREAGEARQRLERAHEEVVKPLNRAAEQNRFAEIIRHSLLEGH